MKNIWLSFFILLAVSVSAKDPGPWFYELRIYRLADAADESRVEVFLQKALVPALHRNGIKNVGVFKPVKEDTVNSKRLYVLIPYKSLNELDKTAAAIQKDAQYLADGSDYLNASHTDAPYLRFETIILKSFRFMPAPAVPNLKGPKQDRVYELRSYEGATEKLYQSKVHMFNEGGEITLFNKLNFNAVFYGEVLSGGSMPNLMYMTCFEDKASRDAHWKTFVDDPEWKRLSGLPQYQKNVSHADIIFLRPTVYSDY
jgi:NIPSNAP